MNSKKTIFGVVAFALLVIGLAVPSTAMSLERAEIRTQFGGNVDQSSRVSFTDEKRELFSAAGLTGYVATNDEFGIFVMEGESSTIESAISDLNSDSRIEVVDVLAQMSVSSREWSALASHTELDTRDQSNAVVYSSQVKKAHIRATFDSSLSRSQRMSWIDSHFNYFTGDGLGGLFVNGNGSVWITIDIEGKASDVNYWINQLGNDPDLSYMTVVDTESNSSTTAEELVSHWPGDIRDQ